VIRVPLIPVICVPLIRVSSIRVPLISVPLICVSLISVPLISVPLICVPLICVPLISVPLICVSLISVPLISVPLICVPLIWVPLICVSLISVPLISVPLICVPLICVPLICVPLICVPLIYVSLIRVPSTRIIRDPAILHVNDPIRVSEHAAVVGNDDDAAIAFAGERAEQIHHHVTALRIERRRRFVGEDNRRIAGDRARDRDALLLAAAEIGRIRVAFGAESHLLQERGRPLACLAARHALEIERERDVRFGGERREEVEALEDESNVVEPDARQILFSKRGHVAAEDVNRAAAGAENAPHDRQQCRLAAAGGPHQQDELAASDVQIDAVEGAHRRFSLGVGLGDVANGDRGLGHRVHPLKTIAGSSRVTLLMDTTAAPTHIASVRTSIPAAIGAGRRIAAPPCSLPRTTM
jgi:hypothetical protein